MKTTYTYTILRYVHDTATGEFANVGVALYAPEVGYASANCRTTYGRLSKIFPGIEGESFKSLMRYIQSRFEEIGSKLRDELPLDGKPESVVALAHSILPPDDSSLQWSEPGSGVTNDPSSTLDKIFQQMVMRYDERTQQHGRDDEEVWRKFKRPLESRHVLKYLQPKKITVKDDEFEFKHAWKNGVWNCLEPVSFDLTAPESITEKAHRWLGQVTSLKEAKDPFKVYLLVGEPQAEHLRPAFQKALSILHKIPVENTIITEARAEQFSQSFAHEIEQHEKKTGKAR